MVRLKGGNEAEEGQETSTVGGHLAGGTSVWLGSGGSAASWRGGTSSVGSGGAVLSGGVDRGNWDAAWLDDGSSASGDWGNWGGRGVDWLGDRASARAVCDGQSGGGGDGVGGATVGQQSSLWAEGGEGSHDLSNVDWGSAVGRGGPGASGGGGANEGGRGESETHVDSVGFGGEVGIKGRLVVG